MCNHSLTLEYSLIMASQFFSSLLSGSITGPQSLINAGGPLPSIPSSAPPQYHAIPDGTINPPDQSRLLQGGLQDFIYAFGPNPSRITTQTQMNIPNKIQLIIPKLFIPAAVADGSVYQDPILEHAISDGDLVFSLKMNREMVGMGSQSYIIYPTGYTDKAVKLVNLATANYILWGLQVGAFNQQGGGRWKMFFSHLCKSKAPSFSEDSKSDVETDHGRRIDKGMDSVWNFIKTYLAAYGVQHGSDMQGGQHEGSKTRVVTNAVDYVSSFAVEGKILKLNNLWRAHDVNENDDLVLALRYMPPQQSNLQFVLSSSNRSSRTERAPVSRGWWYLNPEVLKFKMLVDTPHIHIARSQKMISSFSQNSFGMDMSSWNARASMHGPPLQVTLETSFVPSDLMWFRDNVSACCRPPSTGSSAQHDNNGNAQQSEAGAPPPPPVTDTTTNSFMSASLMQHAYSATLNPRKGAAHEEVPESEPKVSSSSLFGMMLQGQGGLKKRLSDAMSKEDGEQAAGASSFTGGGSNSTVKKKKASTLPPA